MTIPPACAFEETIPLRFLQINTFYQKYLINFYANDSSLAARPADEQVQKILDDGFSAIHNFCPDMRRLGYDSKFIIANCKPAQFHWLKEKKFQLESQQNWLVETTKKQIEDFRPDILFLSDAFFFDSKFIRQLEPKPKVVIGWTGEPVPQGLDWSEFDVILSNFKYSRKKALEYGAKASEHFYPGFVPWLADRCEAREPEYDVVFVGQWSNLHRQRNQIIHALALEADRHKGFTLGLYLLGQREKMPPEVQACCRGERFGLAMHAALRSGRIAINAGILPEAGNMRLFETTGTGVFLLTEYQENIADYFLPGKEIETYKDHNELIDKIYYYLQNPARRESIAACGQKRCWQDHSMERRILELDRIIKKHLPAESVVKAPPASSLALKLDGKILPKAIQADHNLANIKLMAQQERFGSFQIKFNGLIINCHDLLSFYMAAKDIFLQGIYDFNATSRAPVIIDGGGHIGLFTLFAKQKYPNAQITVFEPDRLSLKLLRSNIAANNLENVHVVEAGLFKDNGGISFGSNESDGSSIFARNSNESIKTVRLNEYIQSDIDFLKLNIEGAEFDVIDEIAAKLHLVKEMVVEYHGFPEIPQNLHKILSALDSAGYRYMIHDFDNLTNPATKPPFRLNRESRFFLLIYAKRLFQSAKPDGVRPDTVGEKFTLKPVSRKFGFDRGTPIDRFYIEKFLEQNKSVIHGQVLEIGGNGYTRKYGMHVTSSEVLNVVPTPGTTIVGNLATGENIPMDTFDCIILTQSIQMIYDVRTALQNAVNALKVGGALLITASGISQISRYDMDRWGEYWRFTDKSLKSLLAEILPEENIQIEAFGNIAVAKAFLDGLASHEVPERVLNHLDNDYQVVLSARAFKTRPIDTRIESVRRPATSETARPGFSFQTPLILLYHRIAEDPIDAQLLAVSPRNFESHLRMLATHYRVLPLAGLLEELRQNILRPDTVSLTFDDGYLDNFTNALPLLEKYGIPATVFVTCGMLDSNEEFWWDTLERIFIETQLLPDTLELEAPVSNLIWDLKTPTGRVKAHDEIGAMLRRRAVSEISQFIHHLLSWAALSRTGRPSHRVLSTEQLRRLAESPLIEIGSHTFSHSKLSILPTEIQSQEIKNSKINLEKILEKSVRFLSYPYGTADSFTSETIRIVERVGYDAAIANIQGNVSDPANLMALPRRLVRNWDAEAFAKWMAAEKKDGLEAKTVSARPQNLIGFQMAAGQLHNG